MKRLWIFLFCGPLFAASIVPNRYIVELSAEPMARAASRQHRTRLRAEQATAGEAVRRSEGRVRRTLENVKNALVVEIPDAKAGRLTSIAGVRKVYPVRLFHLMLDHALPLHQVPAAWTQVGIANAGAGTRIAIIDTGVDAGHPGFQDPSMTAPAGFPRANTDADLSYTNGKVIVARSYTDLFVKPDPDPSAADRVGHGTATAMAAAGVPSAGPLATIMGVAPKAYIGSYKVFGTPGVNDSAPEDAILAAIDDAVADGMDIISLSLGSDVAVRFEYDPEVQALENVAAMGIIVVASAGNNGPDPLTVGSPAAAPSVIAVGATYNDRSFSASALVNGTEQLLAVPGSSSNGKDAVKGPLANVATLDGTGLACAGLPADALKGTIALILRGDCSFEMKINNVAAAGALGALVYNNVAGEGPVTMAMGSATLPSEMISNLEGAALRDRETRDVQVTLQFALGPVYSDPARIASFSAKGPNIDLSIKPELLAVGANLYTAAQKLDANGALYDPSGYSIQQGTSFSSPLVAGAAAVLKAARPGLTSAQYRSLLVNTAAPAWLVPGTPAGVQQGGAGSLDLLSALNATAAAAPVSLGFSAGEGTADNTRTLTIWNVGTSADTFHLFASPRAGGPAPELPYDSVPIAPGASVSIPIRFPGGGLTPGQYEGFLNIQGSTAGVTTHIPYWYGVTSGRPFRVTVLYSAGGHDGAVAGSNLSNAVLFRITDESGLPVTGVEPTLNPVSGGGSVVSVRSLNGQVPYAYSATVRLGIAPGPNVFRIQAGDVSKDIVINGK